MKKRVISVVLTAAMCSALLAGCGAGASSSTATSSDNATVAGTTSAETSSADTAETNDATAKKDGEMSDDEYAAAIEKITNGPVGDDSLTGEINIWNWGTYEPQGTQHFNDYYPNIKVNYTQYETADVFTKVTTSLASGGELPDVVLMEEGYRGRFMSMDNTFEVLNADPYNVNEDDLLAFAPNICSNANGDLLCLQVDNCAGGWAYNRELMKKYLGTDDPDEVGSKLSTLDDVIALGEKVAAAGNGDMVFAGNSDIWDSTVGLFTSSAWVTDSKLTTDDSIAKIYDFMAAMDATGSVGDYVMWTPAWNASMADNNVLFYDCPTWVVPYTLKPNDPDSVGKWGLMTAPGGGFSKGGTAYGIPKANSNEQKVLAWAWIHYLTYSIEGAQDFYEGNGTPVLYAPAYDTDLYAGEPDEYFGGQNVTAKFIEISKDPKTKTRGVTKYDNIISDMQAQLEQEIKDGKSSEDAYAELKQMVSEQIPEITVE